MGGNEVSLDNITEFIPKDKFDLKPISTLMEISEDEIQPILPDLLFWIADMNWPVAEPMVNVLTRFPSSIVPLIKDRLKPSETDEDWKYFIITSLIPELPVDAQKLLTDDILRIIQNPSDGEIAGEVVNVANEYFASLGMHKGH